MHTFTCNQSPSESCLITISMFTVAFLILSVFGALISDIFLFSVTKTKLNNNNLKLKRSASQVL